MKNSELMRAIVSSTPLHAAGYEGTMIAKDYHVLSENGQMVPYAGLVDEQNVYHEVLLKEVSCGEDLKKVPPVHVEWDSVMTPSELVTAAKQRDPILVSGQEYSRILGLYLTQDNCGRLMYSAKVLDKSGGSTRAEKVRNLRRAAPRKGC